MKVLFLCHGNLNRSPAAEIILRALRPEHEVKSAGLKTSNGRITARKMRLALERAGYAETSTRSTICTRELIDWADVIYVMDVSNEVRFIEQFGENEKVRRMGRSIGVEKIPDPHFGDNHHLVLDLLRDAILAEFPMTCSKCGSATPDTCDPYCGVPA